MDAGAGRDNRGFWHTAKFVVRPFEIKHVSAMLSQTLPNNFFDPIETSPDLPPNILSSDNARTVPKETKPLQRQDNM